MTAATTLAPTLVVGDWHAHCSACGRGSDLEASHVTLLPHVWGHDPCGVSYVSVALAADSSAEGSIRAIAAELDLPFVGRWPR